jgi:uncharacterized coiled-coil protein SlyX
MDITYGIARDVERTLSLRPTDLIAPLAKAVQEQQALIETLKTRLERLERELEALRGEPAASRTEPPTSL